MMNQEGSSETNPMKKLSELFMSGNFPSTDDAHDDDADDAHDAADADDAHDDDADDADDVDTPTPSDTYDVATDAQI